MKKTVLITGGTGLVGQSLTEALIAKGYKVIIVTRNITGKKQTDNLAFAKWDVGKQQIDTDAVQQADYIIHLAGAGVVEKRWSEAYKKEIRDSRTESSRLLIDALQQTNKVKAVISASAIGWYGADKEPVHIFTEADPPDAGFLGETCKLWETSIDPVTALNKRLVKLRIGIVLSNGGGALAEFKKPLRFGIAAVLGTGNQMVSWIHIDDLCNMFIAAMENENLSGCYNAVAPGPVSNRTLTLSLAKALNGRWYVPVSVPKMVLQFMMGESSIEVLKSTTVSSKKILDTGFQFTFNHIDAALKNLAAVKDRR